MDKKKTLIIVFSIVIITCIIVSIILLTKGEKEGPNNASSSIKEIDTDNNLVSFTEEDLDGLKITDVVIINGDAISSFQAKVTNTKSSAYQVDTLNVIFTIDNQEYTLTGLSNVKIEPKEEKYIDVTIDQQLSKATKISYQVNSSNEQQ